MSIGMMLDDIIMNIFTQSKRKSTAAHQEHLFSRFKDDAIQLCKGSIQDLTWNNTIAYTKRTLRSDHYIIIDKLRKYISGISHIKNTKADQ